MEKVSFFLMRQQHQFGDWIVSLKIPTLEDFHNHDGLHYKILWKETPSFWEFPGFGRNKYQIMRWTKRFLNSENSFMGWVAALHKHHDHGAPARFERQVVCDQCNSSDGAVKRN